MAIRRISHAKGKGSINHNNRVYFCKNVDPARTKNNIQYAKESLDSAYQKCFGEALENYNTKQKRADRKISDYYKHLFGNARKDVVTTSSNKENSFYEIVVGVGDKNTCAVGTPEGDLAAQILDEYARGFSVRNPNFYVFNSILHLDEKTPHLHIDYVPVAHGYKNGLETRNSQSVALQQMGFGKAKDSINEWRKRERKIIRELCEKYGLDVSEETQGRGKTYTPDEYKKMRDEAKAEMRTDPEILTELKDEIRADIEDDLRGEQHALVEEIRQHRNEALELMDTKDELQSEVTAVQGNLKAEQKNFTAMQAQFKPRKDDLDRVKKLRREAKPAVLSSKVSVSKEDWEFLINIAMQHAKISETTLAALESHEAETVTMMHCQRLYLAVATEVAALDYPKRSKLKQKVQDVLKGVEDWRLISCLMDDLADRKPSDLDEILWVRETKLRNKYEHAKSVRDYNQPAPTPSRTKKKSHGHEH